MLLWLTFVVECRSPVLECEWEAWAAGLSASFAKNSRSPLNVKHPCFLKNATYVSQHAACHEIMFLVCFLVWKWGGVYATRGRRLS